MEDGTPKSLKAAIQQGLNRWMIAMEAETDETKNANDFVHESVRDYLAQRFGTEMLESPQVGTLLRRIYELL